MMTRSRYLLRIPTSHPEDDPRWHETHLYRRADGSYYLLGRGGSQSLWMGGGGITSCSPEEAEDHLKDAKITTGAPC